MTDRKSGAISIYIAIVLACAAVLASVIVLLPPVLQRGSAEMSPLGREHLAKLWLGPDATVRLPLSWARSAETSVQALLNGDLSDPLIVGFDLVTALADPATRSSSAGALGSRFEQLMGQRNEAGYWPHEAYDSFPAGWYSAMDFASMALAAFALHDALQEDRFLAAGHELIRQMIAPVSEGGTNHATSRATCWFSEYAWTGMSEEDETFVLNGAMLAMLALETYARLEPGNRSYRDALDCHLSSLERIRGDFVYPDGEWGRYMLQPPTPLHTHYLIYETVEFDALHALTGRPIYRQLADERRERFARNFKVFRSGTEYRFSRLGAPHPTIPDIYATRLIFRDRTGAVVSEGDSRHHKGEPHYFMRGELPTSAETVDLIAYSSASQITMLNKAPLVVPILNGRNDIVYEVIPSHDMRNEGKCYSIQPSLTEYNNARLNLHFEPISLSKFTLFSLDVEHQAPVSWGIGLSTSAGREFFRYVDTPKAGRNIIPLSRFGFAEQGQDDEIVGITIYVYTDAMEDPQRFCLRSVSLLSDYHAFIELVVAAGFDKLLVVGN